MPDGREDQQSAGRQDMGPAGVAGERAPRGSTGDLRHFTVRPEEASFANPARLFLLPWTRQVLDLSLSGQGTDIRDARAGRGLS
jgi:hypothetical protein